MLEGLNKLNTRMLKNLFFVVVISVTASNAGAFCYEPSAPDAPSTFMKPDKPMTPFCVNEFTRTHTCDDWEINMWRSALQQYQYEVEDYVQKLKIYAEEASNFASAVVEYANCEIRNLD